jgi:hypothetical protein
MIRLTDNHAARLRKAAPSSIVPALGRELHDSADIIARDAQVTILDGGISGSGHITSEPGQTPNADTHDLDKSIHAGEVIDTDPGVIRSSVIADSDHALPLELGTTNIAERPFLRPAVERHRRTTVRSLALAYNRKVR